MPENAEVHFDHTKADFVLHVVAIAFGVPKAEVTSATRRHPSISLARQVAMYLTHVASMSSVSRVAMAFGRDRSTASHACHIVEDLRDDVDFDARISTLEDFLRLAPMFEAQEMDSEHRRVA